MQQLINALLLIFLLSMSNVALGHDDTPDITPMTLQKDGFSGLILDVRSAQEYAAGHVPGAINVPHLALTSHLASLGPINKPLLVYCRSGRRAGIALDKLSSMGFTTLYHLDGDMQAWQANELPQDK